MGKAVVAGSGVISSSPTRLTVVSTAESSTDERLLTEREGPPPVDDAEEIDRPPMFFAAISPDPRT